jgi:hypothetical protein
MVLSQVNISHKFLNTELRTSMTAQRKAPAHEKQSSGGGGGMVDNNPKPNAHKTEYTDKITQN